MLQRQWSHTPAGRRYTRRFVPTIILYVAVLLGANWAAAHYHPTGAAMFVLALLPALPIVAIIAIMGLYFVEETDEYLRQRLAFASLIGTGFMLVVTTVWGFLEEGGEVQHMPAYWAFILWAAGMGVTQSVHSWRSQGGDK